MTEIRINQFQSLYRLGSRKAVIADFLQPSLRVVEDFDRVPQLVRVHDEQLERTAGALAQRLVLAPRKHMSVVLIPTFACNLACSYCYEGAGALGATSFPEHFIPHMVSCVRQAVERNHIQSVSLTLLGGEPLLPSNIPLYTQLIPALRDSVPSLRVCAISNGTLVERNLSQLLSLGIGDFQITLDGPERNHNARRRSKTFGVNSFQETAHGIDLLLEANQQVCIRINLDEQNVHSLEELGDFILAKEWQAHKGFSAYVYPVSENGCNPCETYLPETEILEKTLHTLSGRPELQAIFKLRFHGLAFLDALLEGRTPSPSSSFCAASQQQLVFDPHGGIHACWVGTTHPEFKLGQITDHGVSFDLERQLRLTGRNSSQMTECKKCKFRFVCGGGCAYKAVSQGGGIHSPRCSDFDALFETYLRSRLA